MDMIYLSQLELKTLIGVYDWERRAKRSVFVDLEIAVDISKAAQTDNVEYTLDYGVLAHRLTELADQSQFFLIEALADRLATVILEEFNVKGLRLKLSKRGAVPSAQDVGLIIERGNFQLK